MLRSDFARKLLNNSLAHGLNFGSRWLLNLVVARQLLAQLLPVGGKRCRDAALR